MSAKRITLAAVAGAHGLAGEVRLKLFAASLDSLKRHPQVLVGDRMLTLKAVRGAAQPVVRFAEIGDRGSAEALRGLLVTVPRSALPPLGDGEYYHADLIGLACVDADGVPVGTVVAVENFGAGDLLEVERVDGKRGLVAFRPGIADVEGDMIRLNPLFLT